MIDAHAHLTFNLFDKDRKDVIQRAKDAGVKKIITIGTQISSSQEALEIARQHDGVYASVGVHPHHADKITESQSYPEIVEGQSSSKDWIGQLEDLAHNPKVVAIGECGLDNYHYHSNGVVDMERQIEVFEKQIHLAHKLRLPLQIHNRLAWEEVTNTLNTNKKFLNDPPGLLHCFSGTHEYMKKMLNLGFYIGFDGNITYKNMAKGEKVHLTELAKAAPIDRIITETDAPFLSPEPHRGQRNEPKNVIITTKFIAEIKKISREDLLRQVEKNTHQLFKI